MSPNHKVEFIVFILFAIAFAVIANISLHKPEPVKRAEQPVHSIVKVKPVAISDTAKDDTKVTITEIEKPAFKAPSIIIIIDDLGISPKNTRKIMALPGPLTLAFLPYAPRSKSLSAKAYEMGHEILIHMPMEPMNPELDLGGIAIKADYNEAEIQENLSMAFKNVSNFIGINNHMGSRVTQDSRIMDIVMERLRKEHLIYIDSRTISTSIANEQAAIAGIPHAQRDIFIDHEDTDEFVQSALAKAEKMAHKNGSAILIGHPKEVTIRNLTEWIPSLKEKGITLLPVSAVVTVESSSKSSLDPPRENTSTQEPVH